MQLLFIQRGRFEQLEHAHDTFRGVRISWLMLARNSNLAKFAASAASLARSNSVSASVRSSSPASQIPTSPNSDSANCWLARGAAVDDGDESDGLAVRAPEGRPYIALGFHFLEHYILREEVAHLIHLAADDLAHNFSARCVL